MIRPRVFPFLVLLLPLLTSPVSSAPDYQPEVVEKLGDTLETIESHIDAQRKAGHPDYDPAFVYVVDPRSQRLHVLSRESGQIALTLRVGTGSNGVGFDSGQTPPGFYVMGGVRIARNADWRLQTGDTKTGVSGFYAELLYPPSHPDPAERGTVPINVVMHSFNPNVSSMLRERHERQLIGKEPCTTGCPVVRPQDAPQLAPFLEQSAGPFDPSANPNRALRRLIRWRKVREYSNDRLGDAIYVIDPADRA